MSWDDRDHGLYQVNWSEVDRLRLSDDLRREYESLRLQLHPPEGTQLKLFEDA